MSSEKAERTPTQSNGRSGHSLSYQHLSMLGLEYIRQQRHFLSLSLIYPLVTIILQIFNTFFILAVPSHPPEPLDSGAPPPNGINVPFLDQITPAIVFIILAIVALFKIGFISKIRQKAIIYAERQTQTNGLKESTNDDIIHEEKSDSNDITLTDLFYNLIKHLESIQKLSIFFYIACFIFGQWYIRYFPMLFGGFPGPNPSFNNVMFYLNFADFIGLVVYLIPDMRQFLRWNKKLSKLRQFEQNIYKEFELNPTEGQIRANRD